MATDESVRSEVGRIAPIEGLRGIAVLWVIAFHYWVLASETIRGSSRSRRSPLDALVRNGYLGVDLFFLISGFLLAMPWFVHRMRDADRPRSRASTARRFWRIAPAYYVQLAFLFLVVILPLLRGYDFWRSDIVGLSLQLRRAPHVPAQHHAAFERLHGGQRRALDAFGGSAVLPPAAARRCRSSFALPWFTFVAAVVTASLWRMGLVTASSPSCRPNSRSARSGAGRNALSAISWRTSCPATSGISAPESSWDGCGSGGATVRARGMVDGRDARGRLRVALLPARRGWRAAAAT